MELSCAEEVTYSPQFFVVDSGAFKAGSGVVPSTLHTLLGVPQLLLEQNAKTCLGARGRLVGETGEMAGRGAEELSGRVLVLVVQRGKVRILKRTGRGPEDGCGDE